MSKPTWWRLPRSRRARRRAPRQATSRRSRQSSRRRGPMRWRSIPRRRSRPSYRLRLRQDQRPLRHLGRDRPLRPRQIRCRPREHAHPAGKRPGSPPRRRRRSSHRRRAILPRAGVSGPPRVRPLVGSARRHGGVRQSGAGGREAPLRRNATRDRRESSGLPELHLRRLFLGERKRLSPPSGEDSEQTVSSPASSSSSAERKGPAST